MEWTGGASVSSALPFDVRARNVLDHKLGLLAYGYGASNAPFQGGTLCVEAPLTRTPAQDSGGSGAGNCSGVYGFDFNALIQSGADPELVAGVQVFAQYWSRDPQASFTTGLTDALRFYVQP
jgi:hypothetical protein